MKIQDFPKLQSLHGEVRALTKYIDTVQDAKGGGLGVTFNGTYQDSRILDAVRPVVLALLRTERIERLLEIRALGVEVEVPEEPINDWQRLDILESLVEEAHVSACFDIEGGVNLTIERPSQAPEVHRNQESFRDAIDAAIRKLCSQ